MKKRSVFLLFFLYLLITATAQPLHQIRGTVIDKASRKPLEFINVVIAGSGMGSVTDSVGISPSKQSLPVSIGCRHLP